ncbi:MAG: IclR family transcriptional regulator [Alphaproteobacteria bacterium]|nr:IclR family transcriptional regulator [Alphaproteobacteria bacterium]
MSPESGRKRGRPRSLDSAADGSHIQSLDRALGVLKVIATGNGLSLTEVSERMDQPASSTYRALITMQKHGIVDFDDVSQLWHVGLECFRIGSAFLGRTSIMEQSRPIMQRLMTDSGETANLAMIDGSEVIFISQVETHEHIRAFFRPGTRGPAHASGIGKALLAHLPPDQLQVLLRRYQLASFTDNTITSREALMTELAVIRARGWAVDNEERTLGMRCIAAPIFGPFGEATVGVSISGPSIRVSPEKDAILGPMIRQAALDISRAIGGGISGDINPGSIG